MKPESVSVFHTLRVFSSSKTSLNENKMDMRFNHKAVKNELDGVIKFDETDSIDK